MARILFVLPQQYAYPGLYYICGALRDCGHKYSVIANDNQKKIEEKINDFKPILVAFPCLTGIHKIVLKTAAKIKKQFPALKTLVGGIHPTLFPDIIKNPGVDFICRGEGEYPTCELLDALSSGKTSFDIANITWKKNGKIIANQMRQLINPLDKIPFPDYSIFKNIEVISQDTYPAVFMTRGCPFACTYCYNSDQKKLFKGLGKWVRSFSQERILDEVASAIKNYPNTRAVFLGADTLGANLKWLKILLRGYSARFDVPYTCLIRPEFINEDLVRLLKQTNCHMIAFGIESGSVRIRKNLLKRKYSNERIEKAAGLLKKIGIPFRTYNIIGFPTETKKEMLATLKLNIKIKADFPWCSIFTPYPKTQLSEFTISQGYLDKNFSYDDVPLSFFNDTILKKVNRNYILNLHSFFQLLVLFPSLYPILKRLLKYKHNFIFKLVFKAIYSLVCIQSEKRSPVSFLKLALANRKLFK
ncbi:B12-binding domain-containing radical SAM protein [Candidatus Riflebacteria bacterium]